MPVTFRSNAWLPDRDNKLKPKLVSASSASGEVRNPLPSWTVSPFSATAASKLVKTTSPFNSPWITGTATGAVARISDRIIDCPAKVIVMGAGCGRCAEPIIHTIANRTARHAALASIRPVFNFVAICFVLSFRLSARCTRDSTQLPLSKLIYASLFINILGFGEYLLALEGPGLKCEILGELVDNQQVTFFAYRRDGSCRMAVNRAQ